MVKLQFRVLYREFLFRMVDLELLSTHAQGDMSKLFGQFAALLVFLSIVFSLPALGLGGAGKLPQARLIEAWSGEHFLIATTMLVVGLFAVLSWDSTFPDRRDILVLAPLPVRARTMFLAKVAGVAASLGLTVLILHAAAGLVWPLALNSESAAQTVPALTTEPALPPVSAVDLQSVMNRDLAPAFSSGSLAPGTGGGVAIGVSKHGVRHVFAYGTAHPNSIFEIGSVTKTFTALLLAKMAAQGKVKLDEPVRELLPPGTVGKPAGPEITLLDLATHRSGLPPMPTNLNTAGTPNPGADYHTADLYRFLARRGAAKPPNASFHYSNLSFALLGQALANRAGAPWPDLIKKEITDPLGMPDTAAMLSPEQQARMIQAYDARHRPIAPWDLDALAPAGALRSTAADMLTYLEANLHPGLRATPSRLSTLPSAILHSHVRQATITPEMQIALAWIYDSSTGTYWHNGAISGYTSHGFFNPAGDYAAIVLVNNAPGPIPFSELLARHIRERLTGQPAVSFEMLSIPPAGGFFGLLRGFAAYWITMLAAGAFIFCCVLGLQGLAAQLLPRPFFLRVSSWMQLAAFCLFVSVYFLEPMMPAPGALIAAQSQGALAWSPSFWFLGLFQQLTGSPALAPLAQRAWAGLGIAVSLTAVAYALSYFRTLRQILEEPDIAPGFRGAGRLPRFGSALSAAVVPFSVRSLLRSRRHRIILAFYLGVAFALTIFLLRSPAARGQLFEAPAADPWRQASAPLMAASLVIMGFWVVGVRVVFAMPLDLRANWIFRVTPVAGGPGSLAARRRSLLLLSLAPAWAATAALFLWMWPWRPAAAHILVLGLFGMILAEICLLGPQKIPFTCSYLPGRSNIHMTFWLCIGLLMKVVNKAAEFEQRAIESPGATAALLALLGAVLLAARWRTSVVAASPEGELQFDQAPPDQLQLLGLTHFVGDVSKPGSPS